jgi:hypothetical protein
MRRSKEQLQKLMTEVSIRYEDMFGEAMDWAAMNRWLVVHVQKEQDTFFQKNLGHLSGKESGDDAITLMHLVQGTHANTSTTASPTKTKAKA